MNLIKRKNSNPTKTVPTEELSASCADAFDDRENVKESDSLVVCGSEATASTSSVDNKRKIKRAETVKRIAVENQKFVKEEKKISVLGKISLVWTVFSAIYAIVGTCLMIWRGWVTHTVSYVLVAVLAVFVIAFIVLIVMIVRNPKHGKRNVKLYKKLLKIFKAIANIAFLAFTAIALAGMANVDVQGVFRWIVFAVSLLIAAVQLGLNAALLVMKLIQIMIAKKFRVEVVKFVDGRKQKKSMGAKLTEKKYKDD